MAMSLPATVDSLLNAVEQTLEDEQRALLEADAGALIDASQRKQRVLEELDGACTSSGPARFPPEMRTRLHQVMVANSRNQVLLSVLQTRLEDRLQHIGMLDETYGRNGKRSHRSVRTATRSA